MALPLLRWFGAADVVAAMPPLEERLRLAERTMVALAQPGASELPPKIAIHPRPADSFVHAMPAHLRGDTADDDLVGMKWVAGYATNNALGIASISAVVVLNDPETGVPVAMLDGGPITAERTAAVSGVAIRHFGPGAAATGPGGTHVAVVGAGVQGRSHLPVFGGVLPGCTIHLYDRDTARAETFADVARGTAGIGDVIVESSARAAIEAADVVFTAASFGPKEERQSMTNAWLRPGATVVPIDYATYCAAEVARDAGLFLVDQREQFLANRDAGNFDGYPDPSATIGEAILAGTPRPVGRVVVSHLGVGLADLVFADAIVRAAIAAGRGTTLQR
ncbi:MAG: ornithine cyclodeaminase family protein [Chloroflexi bacterium]|nr:ornithine cyclodeaminase family protein [Chloroflexota bacterium]